MIPWIYYSTGFAMIAWNVGAVVVLGLLAYGILRFVAAFISHAMNESKNVGP